MQGAMGICVNISLILTELLSCGYFIASTRRDFRASPFRRGDRTCSLAKKAVRVGFCHDASPRKNK